MSRFDLAALPSWLLALVVLVPLAGLAYWSQRAGAPEERFARKLPDVQQETDETNGEELVMQDFSSLVFVRPQEEKDLLTQAEEVLGDNPELLGRLAATIGKDSGDWHLVGVERQEGELVAIMFYKDDINSVRAGVGDTVHDHVVKAIDAAGVTLVPKAGNTPIRLQLKEEQPST